MLDGAEMLDSAGGDESAGSLAHDVSATATTRTKAASRGARLFGDAIVAGAYAGGTYWPTIRTVRSNREPPIGWVTSAMPNQSTS